MTVGSKIITTLLCVNAICAPAAPGEDPPAPNGGNVREVAKGSWDRSLSLVLTLDRLEALPIERRLDIVRKAIKNNNYVDIKEGEVSEPVGFWDAAEGERRPFGIEELSVIERKWAMGGRFLDIKDEDTGDVKVEKITAAIDSIKNSLRK